MYHVKWKHKHTGETGSSGVSGGDILSQEHAEAHVAEVCPTLDVIPSADAPEVVGEPVTDREIVSEVPVPPAAE